MDVFWYPNTGYHHHSRTFDLQEVTSGETTNNQYPMTNIQWTMDNEQWTMDNGQWTMDNGQ
jgi:hypothetical protein